MDAWAFARRRQRQKLFRCAATARRRVKPGHDGMLWRADVQSRWQFLGRAPDGVSDCTWTGRADHGETDGKAVGEMEVVG